RIARARLAILVEDHQNQRDDNEHQHHVDHAKNFYAVHRYCGRGPPVLTGWGMPLASFAYLHTSKSIEYSSAPSPVPPRTAIRSLSARPSQRSSGSWNANPITPPAIFS